MPASLSRRLAKFVAELSYKDLPPEVVDKVKALTLQAVGSMLLGYQSPEARGSIHLFKEEEPLSRGGSTVMVDGAKVTKGAAAFLNCELVHAGAKLDSYRMLTHPGSAIIPAGLVAAEAEGASGKELITGLAAGYEVMERMAKDFIPSVMARGFHAGPVFSIFGAVVASGKIMKLNEDQMNSAIALSVNLAGGNLEGPRSGGTMIRETGATRNAMLVAMLAKEGMKGGETTLEGDAGFYHSFTGNNKGELSYVFTGRKTTSFNKIAGGTG